MVATEDEWITNFAIQSDADLDFVIGMQVGWPIGLTRASPPELRRRVAAGAISYQLQIQSIDYALNRYVDPKLYEVEVASLGNEVSDFLKEATSTLRNELKLMHAKDDLHLGIFSAEMTLFKLPDNVEAARLLANRGLFLEVLPLLRLSVEMLGWAGAAFFLTDENAIVHLKASNCVADLKRIYETSGRIYGYLSKFSHWDFVVYPDSLRIRLLRRAAG